MHIEFYHASKFGNGEKIADEFKRHMTEKGVTVDIHHVRRLQPKDVMTADLYLFCSPGRFGKPIGDMMRFLKKASFRPMSRYAVIATELCPNPETVIERLPADDQTGTCQRVLPILNQTLKRKGLQKVAEGKIFVTGMQGPLEEDWQNEVKAFVTRITL